MYSSIKFMSINNKDIYQIHELNSAESVGYWPMTVLPSAIDPITRIATENGLTVDRIEAGEQIDGLSKGKTFTVPDGKTGLKLTGTAKNFDTFWNEWDKLKDDEKF